MLQFYGNFCMRQMALAEMTPTRLPELNWTARESFLALGSLVLHDSFCFPINTNVGMDTSSDIRNGADDAIVAGENNLS
jgi:hypothetical protein